MFKPFPLSDKNGFGILNPRKRPQPQPPHTGPTLHRRLQPPYRKNIRFRALPNPSPMQHSCSHYNAFWHRFAAARAHSCSHYNPICIHALQNTKEEPIRPRNDRSRNRRTQDLPFIAGCSHPTRKNTRFRALDSSPTQVPCNIHSSITMRFVMLYDVLLCDVLLCDVLLCDVLFSDEL